MSNNTRILNITRNYSLKHKQALRAIEQCAAAWVVYGETIRDLTLAESIAARNIEAKLREPIAAAELPGLIFRAPVGKSTSTALIFAANKYCAEYAG